MRFLKIVVLVVALGPMASVCAMHRRAVRSVDYGAGVGADPLQVTMYVPRVPFVFLYTLEKYGFNFFVYNHIGRANRRALVGMAGKHCTAQEVAQVLQGAAQGFRDYMIKKVALPTCTNYRDLLFLLQCFEQKWDQRQELFKELGFSDETIAVLAAQQFM